MPINRAYSMFFILSLVLSRNMEVFVSPTYYSNVRHYLGFNFDKKLYKKPSNFILDVKSHENAVILQYFLL